MYDLQGFIQLRAEFGLFLSYPTLGEVLSSQLITMQAMSNDVVRRSRNVYFLKIRAKYMYFGDELPGCFLGYRK